MKKTLNIFGCIVPDSFSCLSEEDVCPNKVKSWLDGLEEGDAAEVVVNSPGGDIIAGLAIANMLRARGDVDAHVVGIAASMASVIVCACRNVKVDEGAFVMIHNPYSPWAEGTADDLRHEADVLDSMAKALRSFYRGKFSADESQIQKWMDEETWISGADVSAYGFKAETVSADFSAAACLTRTRFNNMPDAAAKFVRQAAKDQSMPKPEGRASGEEEPTTTTTTPEAEGEETTTTTPEAEGEEETTTTTTPEAEGEEETTTTTTAEEPEGNVARLFDRLQACEAQRRDFQSALDREKAQRVAEAKDFKAQIDALTGERDSLAVKNKELESRLSSMALNAFAAPTAEARSRTWREAVKECGSYAAAKAKYPELAEEYRRNHNNKD